MILLPAKHSAIDFLINMVTVKCIVQMGKLLRLKEGAGDDYIWTKAIGQDHPRHTGTHHPVFSTWIQRPMNTQYKLMF